MTNNALNLLLADGYLRQVLSKYEPARGILSPSLIIRSKVEPIVRAWAGTFLRSIDLSGSSVKGTAIKGQADVDLFVSLYSHTSGYLSDIYNSLFAYLDKSSFSPKKRNVAIQGKIDGYPVDITPGRLQSDNSGDHSLWRNQARTWCQTNIAEQIRIVQNSRCVDEIRLTKIWRNLNNLDFPSFYLELSVIRALDGNRSTSLAQNFVNVRHYLANQLEGNLIIDPTRSTNRVSDDLTQGEKLAIAASAERSLKKATFQEVVW